MTILTALLWISLGVGVCWLIFRRLKKLHQLIVGSYLGPFFITFSISLFVLLLQFLWKYVDDLMGKGLEASLIIELLFYASANLIPMALPLAILLSSIMTFGNMGEKSELVAMKASGLGLFRIMLPLIIFMTFTSGAAFYFANNLWPVANLKFKSLLWDITEKKPTFNLTPGVFYSDIPQYIIRVGDKNVEDNTLSDILIYDHTDIYQINKKVIRAKSGSMRNSDDENYLILTLEDGVSYEEYNQRGNKGSKMVYPHVESHFSKQVIRMDMSEFKLKRTDQDLFANSYEMLTMSQLDMAIDSFERLKLDREEMLGEYLDNTVLYTRDSIQVNFDSITPTVGYFDSMKVSDRNRTLEIAINQIRNANNYVRHSKEDFHSRKKFIARHRIEWHRKITLSLSVLVLFFIGAPLGAIIRKGGLGFPVVFAVIFFLVYHIISITGEKMAKTLTVDPTFGMWLSAMILIPIGFFLTYKSAKDSALFDREVYVKSFKKFVGLFRKKA